MAKTIYLWGSTARTPTQCSQPTARDSQPRDDRRHVKPIQPDGGGAISLGSAGTTASVALRCARAHSSGSNSDNRSGG